MQTPVNVPPVSVPTMQTIPQTPTAAAAHIERLLDEALAPSFPASDPIAVTAPPED